MCECVPGAVTLIQEHTVCRDGDTLTPEQARLLVSCRALLLCSVNYGLDPFTYLFRGVLQ